MHAAAQRITEIRTGGGGIRIGVGGAVANPGAQTSLLPRNLALLNGQDFPRVINHRGAIEIASRDIGLAVEFPEANKIDNPGRARDDEGMV